MFYYCDPDSRYCYADFDQDDEDEMTVTIDTNASQHASGRVPLSAQDVPLRTGPPTKEELLVHYPAKFTWEQLKTFVNSGDLGLLKRDKKLQVRYMAWSEGIKEKYGSMINYLLSHRLQWGQPDRLAQLKSRLDDPNDFHAADIPAANVPKDTSVRVALPPLPADAPAYFIADTPPGLISIIMNDWPYSVPPEIEHTLIWTRLPVTPTNLPESIRPRVHQDGLWGFTGSTTPPPSPSNIPSILPALAEWGVTMDKLVLSPKGTPEEDELVRQAGSEIDTFVKRRWSEEDWETAWFVNPQRLQSVPGLAHIHVFARYKAQTEVLSS